MIWVWTDMKINSSLGSQQRHRTARGPLCNEKNSCSLNDSTFIYTRTSSTLEDFPKCLSWLHSGTCNTQNFRNQSYWSHNGHKIHKMRIRRQLTLSERRSFPLESCFDPVFTFLCQIYSKASVFWLVLWVWHSFSLLRSNLLPAVLFLWKCSLSDGHWKPDDVTTAVNTVRTIWMVIFMHL